MQEFEWYRVACGNRLEELGKSKIESHLVPFLKYDRKIPVEEQFLRKRDEVHFIVNLYSFPVPPVPAPVNSSFHTQGISFGPSQAEQLPKLIPPLDTLTRR